jgi:substrate import-associated zinc metallohydrolase lipoprotein
MKSKLSKIIIALVVCTIFFSCQEEELGTSIFDTTEETLDSTSYTYAFDSYLERNFRVPYNLTFSYKLRDVAADMDYNLVPSSLENSEKLAVLVKYLWFDVYAKVVDSTFLKKYGPRMIHLIGSPAYNPISGTIILGLAEGGIKISLYRVNSIDTSNPDMLNEYYFKTMHHEFAHILHQTKTYPADFNLISYKYYDPYAWQDRTTQEAASLGFASPYGSSATREDFVEIIANYIVKTDAQWATLLDYASKGWAVNTSGTVYETTDTDGVDGRATIITKLGICRTWLKDSWNINIDSLRTEVQYRQARIDMDSLLSEIK